MFSSNATNATLDTVASRLSLTIWRFLDVSFKQKFYYAKAAHYETATLKDISLIPAEHIMDAVKADYKIMQNMIYGDYPQFEEVLSCLKQLQDEIHNL